tara:strand:- start:1039 stop:1176 length:138 start_codon:yes stop_codon:yes gene_type:complete
LGRSIQGTEITAKRSKRIYTRRKGGKEEERRKKKEERRKIRVFPT